MGGVLGSGVFRISKRGAKYSLATSVYTREGQTKFSNFFTVKKFFFWPKGGYGQFGQGVNTPLVQGYVEKCHIVKNV